MRQGFCQWDSFAAYYRNNVTPLSLSRSLSLSLSLSRALLAVYSTTGTGAKVAKTTHAVAFEATIEFNRNIIPNLKTCIFDNISPGSSHL